jgi:processive 1,2-diacylglycerol beta-glucosyltransferase
VKNILILTAGFGDGHNAAARNLREALEQLAPEAEVTVVDLFERSYKRLNGLARRAYLGLVRYTPTLWSGVFKAVDRAPWLTDSGVGLGRLRRVLAEVLDAARPDCVVSTYPTYAQLIQSLFAGHCERPFRLVTVVTDAGSINSVWFRAPSDRFVVCDAMTGEVLRRAGVPDEAIQPLGFPVSPRFAQSPADPPPPPARGQPFRVLYVINTGQQKAGKAIDRILEVKDVELTITVGRYAELKERLARRARQHSDRLRLLGWTNQMPELLQRSHLVIGKAGGAAVQEALAASCPMVVNQVIPGQEEGNARLIETLGVGAVAAGRRAVVRQIREALADGGRLWHQWRRRLAEVGRTDASLRIARLVLDECDLANHCVAPERHRPRRNGALVHLPARVAPPAGRAAVSRPLLCDFHIHTNYSDGRLTVPEVVDFYGARGFDCICITDHWTDPRRLIGKLARLTPFTLSYDQIEEYFEVIAREARRAWRRYGMLVMTGLEFNQDGPTRKSSAHLLGLDLREPISPRLDLLETIAAIHRQGGLAVAAHPHLMKSEWAKETLYLWEHQEQFIPVIDAWEIANRNNLFSLVSLKRLPFLANSDFHKPKHIYSWKTLLQCEKDPAAIKECIRLNERVSITLYRDDYATNRVEREPQLAGAQKGWRKPDLLDPMPALNRAAVPLAALPGAS